MQKATCENCGAMVQLVSVARVRAGAKAYVIEPRALAGQHARPGLPVHLSKCPMCGAPRDDARTMDTPTGDTVDLEC